LDRKFIILAWFILRYEDRFITFAKAVSFPDQVPVYGHLPIKYSEKS
jgi:hypothetical protein